MNTSEEYRIFTVITVKSSGPFYSVYVVYADIHDIGSRNVELFFHHSSTSSAPSINLISSSAYISPYAKLGWGCVILNNAVIQNGSCVGNGVLLNPGVEVHHDCLIGDYDLIYTNSVVRTNANVGKCVRIGSNVTICNNAVVSDGADVPDCTAVHPEVKK